MRRCLFVLFLFCTCLALRAAEAKWYYNLPEGQAVAKKENKMLLLNFSGSDWCGPCMQLKQNVFSRPEFNAFAQSNMVLVEIDIPRSKPFSPEQLEANIRLKESFNADGFPTIIVMSSTGQELWRLGGYADIPIQQWLGIFQQLKTHGALRTIAAPPASAADAAEPAPARPPIAKVTPTVFEPKKKVDEKAN